MPNRFKRFIVNASWLIKLRWVAVVGQLLTIAAVIFWLQIEIPMLWALLTIIAVTALSNLILALMFARWVRRQTPEQLPWEQVLGVVMAMDLFSLTALLFASGGPSNPFMLFFFVNLSLSALVVNRRWAWWLNAVTIGCFALLLIEHHTIESLDLGMQLMPIRQSQYVSLSQLGLFVAFGTCSSVIVYFMTRLTDELRQQQIDLNFALQKQAHSEKLEALGTLSAGAAHELATPLATIAVVARDVEKAFENYPSEFAGASEMLDDVRLIRQQLDRCRKILDRMASHAGETVGEAFQTVPLQRLTDEVLNELPERNQVHVDQLSPIADIKVKVPLDSICQALRGLVQNAIDVSPPPAQVSINIAANAQNWSWEIRDQGAGMGSEVLQRISEPFFTTKSPGKGMGLGLFLAKNVIQRLGGELVVQSTLGQGTRVTVTMPR